LALVLHFKRSFAYAQDDKNGGGQDDMNGGRMTKQEDDK